MTRSVTNPVAVDINKSLINKLFVVVLELYEEHNVNAEYIRIVNDNAPMTFEGNLYSPIKFGGVLLTDTEEEATAQITVQVVDKRVTTAVHDATNRIRCRILLIKREDDTAIYDTTTMLIMRNITGDMFKVTATLGPAVDEREPIPNIRAYKSLAPGLYL